MRYLHAAVYVFLAVVLSLAVMLPLAVLASATGLFEFIFAAVDGISRHALKIFGKPS